MSLENGTNKLAFIIRTAAQSPNYRDFYHFAHLELSHDSGLSRTVQSTKSSFLALY